MVYAKVVGGPFLHNNRKRPHKAPKHPEFDLQAACVYWFRKNYRNCLIWSTPNEAAATKAAHFRKLGMLAGVSDTVIAMPGRILFVEFKAADGKQSREQKAFERKIRRLGFEYYIVKTEQQFKNIVKGNVEENKE